jgi:hypothetical protein
LGALLVGRFAASTDAADVAAAVCFLLPKHGFGVADLLLADAEGGSNLGVGQARVAVAFGSNALDGFGSNAGGASVVAACCRGEAAGCYRAAAADAAVSGSDLRCFRLGSNAGGCFFGGDGECFRELLPCFLGSISGCFRFLLPGCFRGGEVGSNGSGVLPCFRQLLPKRFCFCYLLPLPSLREVGRVEPGGGVE